ncbi:MAG: 2-keto-4-pentenoate hydratase/2-oxohepta-3-ene-1,7-dioic acid hydratase in catechol pathway [Alphaproteobacteria bacterium]|jgi:2-keto-4-pentenoate hydratase/2-oxohepta-3-ene-1,7-dioic acid hydratase in catechol pathway
MSQLNIVNFNGQIVRPSKVVCVGRNYLEHISELGNQIPSEPVIFMKPNSAICDDLLSHSQEEVHYEGELCFIIKNGIIAGIGFGLDLTKRKLQSSLKEKGLPWERAKAFDNSAVFSEFIEVPKNIDNLSISLMINDNIVQQGGCPLMINKPSALVANINAFMTLIDNDIIMTGTPSGVGKIEKGQVFKGEVFDGPTCLVSKQWRVK